MIILTVRVSTPDLADDVCSAGFAADPNFEVVSQQDDGTGIPCVNPLVASATPAFSHVRGVPVCTTPEPEVDCGICQTRIPCVCKQNDVVTDEDATEVREWRVLARAAWNARRQL
jgi:hypothetical protein